MVTKHRDSGLSEKVGFGKKLDTRIKYTKYGKDCFLEAPKDTSTPCGCGSGASYSSCCEPLHSGKKLGEAPIDVVRARFTAVVYGLVSYIVASTHPNSKEFVSADREGKIGKSKQDLWMKDIGVQMSTDEFSNLDIGVEMEIDDDNEEVEVEAVATEVAEEVRELADDEVVISIEFDQRARSTSTKNVETMSEDITLKKDADGNWLYLLSTFPVGGPSRHDLKKTADLVYRISRSNEKDKALAERKKVKFFSRQRILHSNKPL